VAEALHGAAIRLLRMVRAEDAQSGVGPAQLSALSVLVFHGTTTLGELAAIEQVRPPTMSRIVDGLVRQGLAKRTIEASDRRSVQISTTPRGQKLLLEGKARRVQALTKRMKGLTPHETGILRRAAEILARL
jgi:DNA-binding MarR family transcriptional regulator